MGEPGEGHGVGQELGASGWSLNAISDVISDASSQEVALASW